MSRSSSGPMISCTSPPEQKLPPLEREHDRLDVVGVDERAERIAQLGVGLEGQRVLALRPRQADDGDAALALPAEMLRLEIGRDHRRLPPLRGARRGSRVAARAACRPGRRAGRSASPTSALLKPPSSSSTQLSCAAAIAANSAAPFARQAHERRAAVARRSRCARPAVLDQPVDDAGDVAVRDHQVARQLGHRHAVSRRRASAASTSNCGSVMS